MAHVGTASGFTRRQREPQGQHGDQAQHGGGRKRHAPADHLPQPRRGGHAAHVGDGQAHEHGRHRTRLLVARHHAGRHQRAQAEEGARVQGLGRAPV
ncbi:hypothetical protein G6F35_018944 [Rhizopus arrhizus]|nr:hypothetical protein G6F35_018944 [Rhizopus arrhizus]